MSRPRKEPTDLVRVRESDLQKLRQLQVRRQLPCLADAMTLMAQQYSVAQQDSHFTTLKYTLESVTGELEILSKNDVRFAGWRDSVVTEVGPGEWTIASKLGSVVTIKDGMDVVAVLKNA